MNASGIEDIAGLWHITDMEMWDEEYIHTKGPAYIRIERSGSGDFQFGLVTGSIDGSMDDLDSSSRFAFTWDGSDEMHPVHGRGWIRRITDTEAEGMIAIHNHDRSLFNARRADSK